MFVKQGFDSRQIITASASSLLAISLIFCLVVYLWQQDGFAQNAGSQDIKTGLIIGFSLALGIFSLLLFSAIRMLALLVFTAYTMVISMLIVAIYEDAFTYLSLDAIMLQSEAVAFFVCVSLSLAIVLSDLVIPRHQRSPLIYRWLYICLWLYLLLAALAFILPFSTTVTFLIVITFFKVSLSILHKGRSAFAREPIAAASLFADVIILIAASGYLLYQFGWNPPVFMPQTWLIMLVLVKTLLFVAMLALSFSGQLTQAAKARDEANDSERRAMQAKDDLLKLQEDTQRQLEYSVDERTLELEIAMRELSEANKELERLTAIDALTGLMNRRYFDKRLLAEARRSRREQRCMSIAMLDIDFFKKINDSFGHLAGDACLQGFARLLQKQIQRPSDIICRYGGEEFVVILPGTQLDGASALMEKVRRALETSVTEFEDEKIRMTVSIGLTASIVSDDDQQDLMLAFADKLLYQAKTAGRNKVLAQSFSAE